MKRLTDLVKLQLQIYFKGSSFILPLITTAAFLYTMYTIKPQDIISSYLLSAVFVFLVMIWVGLTIAAGEQEVTEQLLLLRVQNIKCYYTGKILFLAVIALIFNILFTGFPVIQNLLNGYNLFRRELLAADVGNAFFLLGGCAFAGGAVGNFMHPRVIKDRKLAIVITAFMAVLSVTKPAVIAHIPILKWVLWIVPPVMLPAEIYGNSNYFIWNQTIAMFLLLILYGVIYSILKSVICHRNKF